MPPLLIAEFFLLAALWGASFLFMRMGAALLATLCYGMAANFTQRHLHGAHPLATATGSQIGASLGLALPTALFWPTQPVSNSAWTAILALALLCTALAYVLFFRIIAKAEPSKALTVTFLVPVFALLYGSVFLAETVTLWMVTCGVVILCGTLLATGLRRLRWIGTTLDVAPKDR